MKTRQMAHFFHLTFLFELLVTFIFEFEYNQTLFSHGPPFCPFWCSKYLNFVQKLTRWNSHHTFLESRDPEDTKNPYYVFLRPE